MLLKLINKVLSLLVLLRHGRKDVRVRYFYRDTYFCRLVQLKYLIRDYVIRKKYKNIAFNGEFAPELQFVLPFAYWHYKNGTLNSTKSSGLTSELYFFSPHHEEVYDTRTPEGNYNYETPRILYSQDYDMSKWEPVPLKETYRNDIYTFGKPLLIIANRYNMEWDGPPISFLDIPVLDRIIGTLKEKFSIVYNRPKASSITVDNSDIYDLHELEWLKANHPEVILMDDLYQENKAGARNFNHLQLMVYANAECFISVHGGTAVLASYFGGVNIVLSKTGPEHHFNCYQKLYPKLSGAAIYHVTNESQLEETVNKVLINGSSGHA
jgi:hypothetical protein